VRFFLWGLPAFALAVPLNYTLVHWAGWDKALAYAVVLTVQVTINFFSCRFLVFDTDPELSVWRSFVIFFNGIILFRVADWLLYVLLATCLGLPFLGVQIFNVAFFGWLKFQFSRRVFENEGHDLPSKHLKPNGD